MPQTPHIERHFTAGEIVRDLVIGMSDRLVPLGTNGFIPTQGRHTMSYLLLAESAILLDAGSGVARLLEPAIANLLEPYPSLSIILSHYHLDHVVGLSYLPGILGKKPATIYAPSEPLVRTSAEKALGELIRPPYFPLTFAEYPMPVSIVPVTTESLQIGPISVRLRPQKHAGGSAGMRIGKMAYITDTVVDKGTAEFVSGVSLLLHEVWLEDAAEALRTGHSDTAGVVGLATKAGAGSLMIVHHHPRRSLADLRIMAETMQHQTTVPIIIPEEGKVYEF
jgi:ribonuclease BN (tRNA processing enzyme)